VAKAEKWFEIRVEKGEIKDDQDAHRPQITKNDLRTCLDEIYPLLPARDHSTILNRLNPVKTITLADVLTALGRAFTNSFGREPAPQSARRKT
jgi:hypothetical protein